MTNPRGAGHRSSTRGDIAAQAAGAAPAALQAAAPGLVLLAEPASFCDPAAEIVRIPQGIRSKQLLLAVLADKLRFPRYFGWNWDALEELLRDLSWLPDKPLVILHEDLPFGAAGENRAVYADLIKDVAAHWHSTKPGRLRFVLPAKTSRDTS